MLLYSMLLTSIIGIFLLLVLDINKKTIKKIALISLNSSFICSISSLSLFIFKGVILALGSYFLVLSLDFNKIELYVIELYLLRFLITYVVSGWESPYTLAIRKETIEMIVLSLKLVGLLFLFLVIVCFESYLTGYIDIFIGLSTNNMYKLFSLVLDIINWPVLDNIMSTVKTNGIHISNDMCELKDLSFLIPVLIIILTYDIFFSYIKSIQNNSRKKYISLDLVNKIKHYLPKVHMWTFCFILYGLHLIFSDLFLLIIIINLEHRNFMMQLLFVGSWILIDLYFDKIISKTKENNFRNYFYFSLFQLILGLCLCIIPNYFVLYIYRVILGVGNILLINFILNFEILSIKSIFRAILCISIYILTGWSIFSYILSNICELPFNLCLIFYGIVIEICNIEVLLNKKTVSIFMFKVKYFIVEVYNFINKVKLTKYLSNILIMLSYGCILVSDYILKMEGLNPFTSSGGEPSGGSSGDPGGDPGGGNFNNFQIAGNDDDAFKFLNDLVENNDPDIVDKFWKYLGGTSDSQVLDFTGGATSNIRARSASPIDQPISSGVGQFRTRTPSLPLSNTPFYLNTPSLPLSNTPFYLNTPSLPLSNTPFNLNTSSTLGTIAPNVSTFTNIATSQDLTSEDMHGPKTNLMFNEETNRFYLGNTVHRINTVSWSLEGIMLRSKICNQGTCSMVPLRGEGSQIYGVPVNFLKVSWRYLGNYNHGISEFNFYSESQDNTAVGQTIKGIILKDINRWVSTENGASTQKRFLFREGQEWLLSFLNRYFPEDFKRLMPRDNHSQVSSPNWRALSMLSTVQKIDTVFPGISINQMDFPQYFDYAKKFNPNISYLDARINYEKSR